MTVAGVVKAMSAESPSALRWRGAIIMGRHRRG